MLKLEKICVTFDEVPVLKELSCKVETGDFITIVGPNGAGKSTLFDVISGKTLPDSGSIRLDGEELSRISEWRRATIVGRGFQNTHLGSVASMTVAENLAMAAYKGQKCTLAKGMRRFPEHVVEEILKPLNLGLENLLHKPMGSLSGGQRQILAFVMATLVPPRILLLDEPTAALDPASATKLLSFALEYIRDHRITTLFITHDPHMALQMGNKLWIIEEGRVSKQFGEEKRSLSPDHLIGQVDYSVLR